MRRDRTPALGLAALAFMSPLSHATGSPSFGPDPEGYWGFAAGLHPEEAARRGFPFPPDFHELRATGARHVLLPVSWAQDDVTAVHIQASPQTLPDPVLRTVIARAQSAGLGVVLLPMVEVRRRGRGKWRGALRPSNPAVWWRSYGRFMGHYAELAGQAGVSMLVIGSELSSLSGAGTDHRWRALARSIRQRYHGPLAFGANHDALDQRAPFDFVDVIGVSAYFPLTRSPDPSPEELGERWEEIVAMLSRLRSEIGKPLILLEVGYPSVDGAARRPWDYTGGAPIDLVEQRDAYRALVDALVKAPALDGALFWTWLGPGGRHDRWYTPRGKPALAQARRLFRARAR